MAKLLDGTADAWVIADPNKPDTSLYSISFWIKPTASRADRQAIVSYGRGTNGSAGTGWEITLQTGGQLRWDAFDTATNFNAPTTLTLTDGVWTHVCLVRASLFQHRVYIDATDATADETLAIDPGATQLSTDDFHIGKPVFEDNGGLDNLTGGLAHICYWQGVALTGAQVASIADKSTCPSAIEAASLEVFCKLTSGAAVTDSSSNAFSVTEEGNPTNLTGPTGLPCDGSLSSDVYSSGVSVIKTVRMVGF